MSSASDRHTPLYRPSARGKYAQRDFAGLSAPPPRARGRAQVKPLSRSPMANLDTSRQRIRTCSAAETS